jgi:hypothetical protein
LKLAISFARRYLIRLNYEAREKYPSLIWIHSIIVLHRFIRHFVIFLWRPDRKIEEDREIKICVIAKL